MAQSRGRFLLGAGDKGTLMAWVSEQRPTWAGSLDKSVDNRPGRQDGEALGRMSALGSDMLRPDSL